jgi:cytidylate kinase
MQSECFKIAIDGVACSGKGTVARRLTQCFDGFKYLDTGLLYRAVTLSLIRDGKVCTDPEEALDAARNLDLDLLTQIEDLQSEEVNANVSYVSKMMPVRQALLGFQRDFANGGVGVVLDGRDIGTVILPDAHIKFFIQGDPRVRAKHALTRLRQNGQDGSEEEILQNILRRDKADREREHAPMIPADDAIIVDMSDMSKDEEFYAVKNPCEAAYINFMER